MNNNFYINKYGNKFWINDKGQRHRLDGPAIEGADGTESWWINGKRHRLNEPAVEYANEHKEWFLNDKLYRLDGPAVERSDDGTKNWWIQHCYVTSINYFLKLVVG